ncbi:SRPBCC family protein [Niabella drilacis]|uniref:START domain-containing protein n=1 Tax=Niabella drilacis (strain DSM 25811 / CCM 8410 / CCUG 62505 / LMG 26954 / E90) TaxID=1285928 RepID=A0A1G6V6L6_NIADE|nr:hypothetical protein [Niabella drilacis]SDD49161.1 hypothetical protein SAMN04487894_109212 [Niabella drilacis]
MKKIPILLLLVLVAGLLSAAPSGDFKLVKISDGIRLYERWVMHNGNKVRELKLSFDVVGAGAADVVALLKDAGKGSRWNVKSSQYKITPTRDENVWLNYIRYSLPWPMEDQDCSLRYSYAKGNPFSHSGIIYFESIRHQVYPQFKNVTRLEGTAGRWVVDELAQNQSRITYQILTNKSGSVPRWVSDPIVYDNILTTMARFKSLLQHS